MAPESCNLDKDEAEILKPSSPSSASSVPPPPPPSSSLTSTSPSLCPKPCEESTTHQRHEHPTILPREVVTALSPKLKANSESSMRVRFRCSTCQRKVGLTGFRCRCGDLFCGRHRYSDVHDCSFDYKAFGRPEIAKANPLIRAAKIIKI